MMFRGAQVLVWHLNIMVQNHWRIRRHRAYYHHEYCSFNKPVSHGCIITLLSYTPFRGAQVLVWHLNTMVKNHWRIGGHRACYHHEYWLFNKPFGGGQVLVWHLNTMVQNMWMSGGITRVTTIITNHFEANNRIVRGEQEKVYVVMAWKKMIRFFKELRLWLNMSTKSLSVMLENIQVYFYFFQKGRFTYEGIRLSLILFCFGKGRFDSYLFSLQVFLVLDSCIMEK